MISEALIFQFPRYLEPSSRQYFRSLDPWFHIYKGNWKIRKGKRKELTNFFLTRGSPMWRNKTTLFVNLQRNQRFVGCFEAVVNEKKWRFGYVKHVVRQTQLASSSEGTALGHLAKLGEVLLPFFLSRKKTQSR